MTAGAVGVCDADTDGAEHGESYEARQQSRNRAEAHGNARKSFDFWRTNGASVRLRCEARGAKRAEGAWPPAGKKGLYSVVRMGAG